MSLGRERARERASERARERERERERERDWRVGKEGARRRVRAGGPGRRAALVPALPGPKARAIPCESQPVTRVTAGDSSGRGSAAVKPDLKGPTGRARQEFSQGRGKSDGGGGISRRRGAFAPSVCCAAAGSPGSPVALVGPLRDRCSESATRILR